MGVQIPLWYSDFISFRYVPRSVIPGSYCSSVWMWELDHKEGWEPKNWCFRTVVLEKILESSLGCKDIQPVHPKGNRPWIFIGSTDAEDEAPILWPSAMKSRLTGKDPDAGEDWGQEEKGVAEGEMVGWHPKLNGHEFEQTLGDSEGQGSLVCCSPWSCRVEHDLVTENKWLVLFFWGNSVLFSIVAAPIYFPTKSTQGSLFSISLLVLVSSCLLDNSHSNRVRG